MASTWVQASILGLRGQFGCASGRRVPWARATGWCWTRRSCTRPRKQIRPQGPCGCTWGQASHMLACGAMQGTAAVCGARQVLGHARRAGAGRAAAAHASPSIWTWEVTAAACGTRQAPQGCEVTVDWGQASAWARATGWCWTRRCCACTTPSSSWPRCSRSPTSSSWSRWGSPSVRSPP